MPTRTSTTGSELFIVDNSDVDWKVVRYLRDWCQLSTSIDVATGYFEIGSLRTKNAFVEGLKGRPKSFTSQETLGGAR